MLYQKKGNLLLYSVKYSYKMKKEPPLTATLLLKTFLPGDLTSLVSLKNFHYSTFTKNEAGELRLFQYVPASVNAPPASIAGTAAGKK